MSENAKSREDLHPIIRARVVVLALFVALCAWLIPGMTQIQNDDDVLAFLPPGHPDVEAFHEVADRFGMLEVALVGLEPESGDILEPATIGSIRELNEKLSELPGVRISLSFADLPHPQVVEEGLIVEDLVPEGREADEGMRERVLGSRDAVGNVVSPDGKAGALLIFLMPRDGDGPEAFARRRETLENIRAAVDEHWGDKGRTYYGGAPFVEMAASNSSRTDIERLSPIVILVLVVASAFLLRSVAAAFLNLIVTGLGVALIMGAHGRFAEPFTIVSSSTPVMMVALGGAFGMHVLAGYQRQEGTSPERASKALRELWLPVLLSGLTTSVAFFALVVMPQVPMQRFGVMAGIGVLVLLGLAQLVLPCLLSLLPSGWFPTRDEVPFPIPPAPPWWALVLLAALGVGGGMFLRADPDTGNVFGAESEPAQANQFFEEHFGGSVYLQVAVEGDLNDVEVMRRIRDVGERIAVIEGVQDVRSLVEPTVLINEGLGGRKGLGENSDRNRRGLTYLIGHPAMAQLMTTNDKEEPVGALIHVKLDPMDGWSQVAVASEVRSILDEYGDTVRVGDASLPAVAEQRTKDVATRLQRLTGAEVDVASLDPNAPVKASPALLKEVEKLRDEALDDEEGAVAVEVPDAEKKALKPADLLEPRGEKLEKLMREKLPTVVEEDPEGIEFAAEHLGAWIDEAKGKFRVEGYCAELGWDDRCDEIRPALAELDDEQWAVPAGVDVKTVREVPVTLRLVGQPVIGHAFGQSVTTSLWQSTLVSLVALAVVLLLARSIFALTPAVWTLAFTAGLIGLLGHSISVGTSMVSCIALGAGVDFAIHLGYRARTLDGPEPGRRAVQEIGGVVLVSAVQLSLAFLVLAFSAMTPLQEFGIGLAIGLTGAALGAVLLTPLLVRERK